MKDKSGGKTKYSPGAGGDTMSCEAVTLFSQKIKPSLLVVGVRGAALGSVW